MSSSRSSRPPEHRQPQDQNQRALQHALQSQQRKRGASSDRAEGGQRKGRPQGAPYDPPPSALGQKRDKRESGSAPGGPERSSDTT